MRTQPQEVIAKLEADNSRLAKEAVILEAMEEGLDEFFEGVKMALDPLYTFGVKQVPDSKVDGQGLPWEVFRELADKLQLVANSKGMKKLGVDDIEAIVSMPDIPTVNESLVDMSLQEFAERTYGAKTGDRVATQEESSVIKQLFGYGDKDRVKKELAETEYMGGMSIADINEMANQADYRSLMPEATMTFLDVEQ